jgi:hypothetical protein
VYGGGEDACRILVGNPNERRPLTRATYRQQNNVKMDLMKIGCEMDSSGSG